MLKIILILLSAILVSQASGLEDSVEVVVIYSQNSNGLLENCHCPEHAYGALEKRAFVVDSIRKVKKHVLLLESGDVLDIVDNALLHKYVVKAYRLMQYDAWVPGDQDFVQGADFFINRMIGAMGTLLNSNILYKNTLIGQRYLIKTFDSVKIGITGTFNPKFYKYLHKESQKKFRFENQEQRLEEILVELEGKCDYLILLSHSGMEQDKYLAERFPKFNLIIGGHSQTLTKEPVIVNGTYIVQAGESGYRLGIVELLFVGMNLESCLNKFILLDKKIKDHPEVINIIKEYHKKRLAEK